MTPPVDPYEAPVKPDNASRRYAGWAIVAYFLSVIASALFWRYWQ